MTRAWQRLSGGMVEFGGLTPLAISQRRQNCTVSTLSFDNEDRAKETLFAFHRRCEMFAENRKMPWDVAGLQF